MNVDNDTYPPEIEDHLPDAIERLEATNVDRTKVPNLTEITTAIVRLRLNDGVVVFTRSKVETEFELPDVSSMTINNRLKTLVEAGVLAVDTTGDAHRYTLAVPCLSEPVPVEMWQSKTESFTPTTLDGIEPKEPIHAAIESDAETPRWESLVEPEQWPAYGQRITVCGDVDTLTQQESKEIDGENSEPTTQSPTIRSGEPPCVDDRPDSYISMAKDSTNQYAQCGAIARKVTAGFGVSAIVAGGVFGQLPAALTVAVLALFAFSAWIVLGLFGSITDRWRDPADARPADIVDRLTRVV